jgi:predicted transcriptional regulator
MQSLVFSSNENTEIAKETVRTGEFRILYEAISSEELSSKELERIERAIEDEKQGSYVPPEEIMAYLKS